MPSLADLRPWIVLASLWTWPGQVGGQAPDPPGRPAEEVDGETVAIEVLDADRLRPEVTLQAGRRLELAVPVDGGIVEAVSARAGDYVRAGQELFRLDETRAEVALRLAEAGIREQQGELELALASRSRPAILIARARLEAAEARAELAERERERHTILAPFDGRLLEVAVVPGQRVAEGARLATLVDAVQLRALVPFERGRVRVGEPAEIWVGGETLEAQVEAVLPLPEALADLRRLTLPMVAAWVVVENREERFEPGQRVVNPRLPSGPLAVVPAEALPGGRDRGGPWELRISRGGQEQVIGIRVLGEILPGRYQVAGPLRPGDEVVITRSRP